MKKIIMLLVLILIYITFNNLVVYSKEKIDLNLINEEIAIVFINNNILVSNKSNTLLLFNEIGDDINKFNKIDVININNVSINIEYEKCYNIKDIDIIDDVYYKINNNLIRLKYNNYNFCIYNNQNDNISNTYGCNFLYLYNTKNIDEIDADENIDIIFFNEDTNIPTYFLEDIYSKWIDIYRLKEDELVVLKLDNEDYQILVIPNS